MRWHKPTLSSIYGLLGQTNPAVEKSADARMEEIRQVLLDAMSIEAVKEGQHLLVRRVFYATDIETLWYARSEVMSLLAEEMGEALAQEKLCAITAQFVGLLPEAGHTLPSASARSPRRK